jgi:hypothetical protein
MYHAHIDQLGDGHPDEALGPSVLLLVVSSCGPKKFCTLSDHVQRYNGSRTTSLHRQGDGKASFLSGPRTSAGDSYDIYGIRGLCDLLGQLC